MAKINPANVAPDAYPRVRGVILSKATKNGIVVQAWPKKRGPPTSFKNQWNVAQWSIAARMAANAEPMSWETAEFMCQNTVWMPRDILMMAAYGKLYELTGPEGEVFTQASHAAPARLPPGEWRISASSILPLHNAGYGGYTNRQLVPASAITNPDGSLSRITFQASAASGAVNILAAYIGKAVTTGNPYAFQVPPVQLFFGGSATATIPQATLLVSDEAAYAPATGDNLVISVAYASPSTPARASAATAWTTYYKFGNDAATIAAIGYTSYPLAIGTSLVETFHLA